MGELPHFRTAVGGFHKSDVSEYIAKIAKEHQNQLQEKDKEIQQLRQQLDEARDQLSQQAAAPKPEAAPTSALEAPAESQEETLDWLELEAYRRAEAAERIASKLWVTSVTMPAPSWKTPTPPPGTPSPPWNCSCKPWRTAATR